MLDTHSKTDRPVRGMEAPPAVTVPRRRRPFGVIAVVVLLVLNFAASFLSTLLIRYGWEAIPAEQRVSLMLELGFGAVLGSAGLVVALGLFRMRRWAWYGVMILTGVNLLLGIWQYFRGGQPFFDLLLNSLIVFYLNQRDVQRLFHAARPKERTA